MVILTVTVSVRVTVVMIVLTSVAELVAVLERICVTVRVAVLVGRERQEHAEVSWAQGKYFRRPMAVGQPIAGALAEDVVVGRLVEIKRLVDVVEGFLLDVVDVFVVEVDGIFVVEVVDIFLVEVVEDFLDVQLVVVFGTVRFCTTGH
jgi:hypothetical protein